MLGLSRTLLWKLSVFLQHAIFERGMHLNLPSANLLATFYLVGESSHSSVVSLLDLAATRSAPAGASRFTLKELQQVRANWAERVSVKSPASPANAIP
eukprot:s1056_g3.t1